MLVVSWNIEMGVQTERAAHELSGRDELSGADVVLLQEVDAGGAALIAEQLDMHFGYAAAAAHPRTGRAFGNAVLSRSPIGAVREIALPFTAAVQGQPRSALQAQTSFAGQPVVAYSVHTETALLSLSKRSQQFRAVANAANDHAPPAIIVVGGDFNTVTGRGVNALHAAMETASLRPANQDDHPTFVRLRKSMRLDHLYTRGLRARRSGVSRATTASDHFPVWTKFEIDPLI